MEPRRSGGLRIDFRHLGIFSERLNVDASIRKAATAAMIEPASLEVGNTSHRGGSYAKEHFKTTAEMIKKKKRKLWHRPLK